MNRIVKIPYGRRYLTISMPERALAGILQKKYAKHPAIRKIAAAALDNPHGSDKLEKLASRCKNILIVVPDSTRSAHLKEILPAIIKRIDKDPRSVDIIVATGMHKKHDKKELTSLVGPKIMDNHRVMCHTQAKNGLKEYGVTRLGVPIVLNKLLEKYDLIVSVGVIEPHLYAGFSGGIKTVAIGLAGEKTISATHSIKFLDNPLTAIGALRNNPFQDTLWEIVSGSGAKIGFSINIVNDPDGNTVAAFAGNVKKVFEKGVSYSRRIFEAAAKDKADIVICGIGYPKDINLYQASRAINYVVNTDKPVIKKGGVLIIAAELRDGAGYSGAEKTFYRCLKSMSSPERLVCSMRETGCAVGEHRAFMVAKALMEYEIVFVNKGAGSLLNGLGLKHFDGLNEAVQYAFSGKGDRAKAYVIPRALSTIAQAY